MKNLDKQLESHDYTQFLSQLKSFIQKNQHENSQDVDMGAVTSSDLSELAVLMQEYWQAQATALERSTQKLEAHEQAKRARLSTLTGNIKQGFLSLNLNPKRDAKGYLVGTSLERTRDSALQSDWQKVGTHLMLSVQHYQNS